MPTRHDDYLLNIFVAVVVVAGVRLVGIVMITAFLVIPAATARLFSPTLAAMTLLSILLGIVSVLGGLAASYQLDVPIGATIILGQALLFFGATLSTLARRN